MNASSSSSALDCGFVGLGAMGAPMARHLHARGMLFGVANRSLDKAIALADELGVRAAASLGDLGDCDAVMLCVPQDADVLQCVNWLASTMRAGSVVIDHSTVAPDTAREAADRLYERGIGFLDAPVSGGVEGARSAKLSIMVGGEAQMLELARPALECYAARITHMGASGAGQEAKAVNQVLVAGIAQAVCEGLALADRLGLDPERLIPTLSAGAAGNWFLDRRGASMLLGQFAPGFKAAHLLKDLRIVRDMAATVGIRHPVIEQSLADYSELVQQGRGEQDTSALIDIKRALKPR